MVVRFTLNPVNLQISQALLQVNWGYMLTHICAHYGVFNSHFTVHFNADVCAAVFLKSYPKRSDPKCFKNASKMILISSDSEKDCSVAVMVWQVFIFQT